MIPEELLLPVRNSQSFRKQGSDFQLAFAVVMSQLKTSIITRLFLPPDLSTSQQFNKNEDRTENPFPGSFLS